MTISAFRKPYSTDAALGGARRVADADLVADRALHLVLRVLDGRLHLQAHVVGDRAAHAVGLVLRQLAPRPANGSASAAAFVASRSAAPLVGLASAARGSPFAAASASRRASSPSSTRTPSRSMTMRLPPRLDDDARARRCRAVRRRQAPSAPASSARRAPAGRSGIGMSIGRVSRPPTLGWIWTVLPSLWMTMSTGFFRSDGLMRTSDVFQPVMSPTIDAADQDHETEQPEEPPRDRRHPLRRARVEHAQPLTEAAEALRGVAREQAEVLGPALRSRGAAGVGAVVSVRSSFEGASRRG